MSREYAEQKIKQALELTRGNATQARQQVIAWCHEDTKLLQALTYPHMTGIVAHAINRVVSGKSGAQAMSPAPEKAMPQNAGKEADQGEFGMEILKTIAGGDTAQFGQENAGRPVGKRGASQRHIDAIQKMVDKGQGKDKI